MKTLGTLAMVLAFASVAHAQTLEFTNDVYGVNEGAGTVTLTVIKDGTAPNTITVHYSTRDGFAATAPGDYIATSGILTFAPNAAWLKSITCTRPTPNASGSEFRNPESRNNDLTADCADDSDGFQKRKSHPLIR